MKARQKPHKVYDYDMVMQYIITYKRANDGNSPSYSEIGHACRISNVSVVAYILRKLEGQGKISLGDQKRGIRVIGGQWSMQA